VLCSGALLSPVDTVEHEPYLKWMGLKPLHAAAICLAYSTSQFCRNPTPPPPPPPLLSTLPTPGAPPRNSHTRLPSSPYGQQSGGPERTDR
jgi:hypothetical protein